MQSKYSHSTQPQHTATAHSTQPQHTATAHSHSTHPQHTATACCHSTQPQHTAAIAHSHSSQAQHTATAHIQPQHTAATHNHTPQSQPNSRCHCAQSHDTTAPTRNSCPSESQQRKNIQAHFSHNTPKPWSKHSHNTALSQIFCVCVCKAVCLSLLPPSQSCATGWTSFC